MVGVRACVAAATLVVVAAFGLADGQSHASSLSASHASAAPTTPACSTTVVGSSGATAKLCITAYPDKLDNRGGIASPAGPYAATVSTANVKTTTVLGCPGQRLKPTLCVTWTVNGGYALSDLFAPFQWQLFPMFYAAGPKTVTAPAYLDGKAVSASVPLTIVGLSSPNAPSPNSGRKPGVTTALPSVATIAAVGDAPASQTSAIQVANLVASWKPDMLLYLGDVYQRGSYQEFLNHWHPGYLFGRFNAITAPVPGNHEYKQWSSAAPYFWYWNYGTGGPTATRGGRWYSFNLAGWHVISLDSDAAVDAGSPQVAWLKKDLAAHPRDKYPCTLAMWHRPRFSTSSIAGNSAMTTLWEVMVPAGVDIFLNAHAHQYERFLPLRSDGSVTTPGNGVTQFVVGTGGNGLGEWRAGRPTEKVAFRTNTFVGAIRFILRPGAADFQFTSTEGVPLDVGTVPCTPGGPLPTG